MREQDILQPVLMALTPADIHQGRGRLAHGACRRIIPVFLGIDDERNDTVLSARERNAQKASSMVNRLATALESRFELRNERAIEH
jgi:hypothetical protein